MIFGSEVFRSLKTSSLLNYDLITRMFDEEYVEWENATQKCQELGARLPVLSDPETIKIVKKYLDEADFEVFEVICFTILTTLQSHIY